MGYAFGREEPAPDVAGARHDPIQAHRSDCCGSHDRCGGDPDRPDFPGSGDLAAVRPGLLDLADGSGYPGHLRRFAGRWPSLGKLGIMKPTDLTELKANA